MTKYESQVYTLNTTQAEAYARMADLRRFEVIKQALSDPERLQSILQYAPEGQVTPERLEEMRGYLENMTFTEDALSADTQMGHVTLARSEERRVGKEC